MKKHICSLLACASLLTACSDKQDYDATGIFEATTVTVSSETTGRILSMPVSEGDTVFNGEIIAQIDTITLCLQYRQITNQQHATRSSLPDISAQAAALRSQIAHAQTEVERQSRLLADGATTQKNYDDATSQLRTLKAQLEGLLSSLGTSTTTINENAQTVQYQAEQIAEQIDKSTVRSPLTGTILVKYAEQGEFAAPGKPLYKVANLNDIYLRSYFTANQLANIKLGQKVTVIADFGGDEQFEYPGVISWIAEESEFTPKSIQTKDNRANLVYAVKIKVRNDGRLKLGQYGEVRL